MVVGEIIAKNMPFVFAMVILGYTILSNRSMYRGVRKSFIILISLVIFEAIVSQTETYLSELTEFTATEIMLRKIFSTLGYALRPAIMYTLLLIIIRNDSKRRKALCGIPFLLCTIVLLINIPFGFVFFIGDTNNWYGGPFSFITYGTLFIYLGLILVFSIIKVNSSYGMSEMITVVIGIAFIVFNIIAEREISGYSDQSQNATAMAVLVYVLHFKNVADRQERVKLETREQKTGLLNENACISELNRMNTASKSMDYAAVYFDLARFGFINDKYGMEIGNRVLTEYAKTVENTMRSDEILARQGGDRFIAVVLKRNLDIFLNQLHSTQVKFSEKGNDYDISVGAHIGIYMIEDNTTQGEEIISSAYTALNYGKTAGNEVTYMTTELRNALKDEKQFAMDIPVAMAHEEFLAYYQPKVNSRTNMLCGAEALVRWMRNGALVPPGKFIPVMETKDLMCDMDFYMLRHVCADISKWIEQGLVPPTISVNFSRRNLSNSHLAADIDAVVREYHVPKKMIEIEITETIDEFPISVLRGFVDELHKLGYKVAVDDFGSGSSSLSLLREVTFDTLKIDKGFVDRAYAKDLTILSYMIKLAKAIGLEILAEGVEQKEQVGTLLSLGCEIIQGYYFDKPLSKDVFEKRIISRRYNNGQDQ